MSWNSECDLEDVLLLLDQKEVCILLFIDQQAYCKQYAEFSWVKEIAHVVEVDQEIVEHFQIGKVPQWRFYLKGTEVHYLIGTVSREEVTEHRNKILGNVVSLR